MSDNSRGPIDTDSTMTSLGRVVKENVLPTILSTTHPIVKQRDPMGWVDWDVEQHDVMKHSHNDICVCVCDVHLCCCVSVLAAI